MASTQRFAHAACPICASPSRPTDAFLPTPLCRCQGCGLVFRGHVNEQSIERYYLDDVYAAERMAAHTRRRRFDAGKRAGWVRSRCGGTHLLDVGAGTGFFVAAASERGFHAIGIEPSDLAASFARERLGVDVRTGYLTSGQPVGGPVDVVSLWHVLEHAPDPVALLGNARDQLRDEGTLVVEVPNIESVGAAMFGGRWAHLDPDAHICHFAPRSLAVALERAGFELLDLSTMLENYYDPPALRWRPRRIAGRLVRSARLRTLRLTHPRGGELLRALARPL